MKKMKFYAMALAALVIVSCSKEDVTPNIDPSLPGEQAQVTLHLKGSADDQPKVKAGGDDETSLDESKINDIVVFVFKAAAGTDATTLVDKAPVLVTGNVFAAPIAVEASTNAKSIYVIANTGLTDATFAGTNYANVKTLADLKALRGDLMNGEVTQTTGNLFMSGGEASNITYSSSTVGSAVVNLKFVASKIIVTIDDKRTNQNKAWEDGVTNITIDDKSIALLFAGKKAVFFGDLADKIDQTEFYSGIATTTIGSVTVKDALKTDLTFDTPDASGAKKIKMAPYHFYTFAHQSKLTRKNSTDKLPIVVTIVSKKLTSKGGTAVDTYYPIHFDEIDALKDKGGPFQPGTKYTVAVTLKGDVNAGGGGGTTDPEVPVVDISISITVTAATWDTVDPIKKTFS